MRLEVVGVGSIGQQTIALIEIDEHRKRVGLGGFVRRHTGYHLSIEFQRRRSVHRPFPNARKSEPELFDRLESDAAAGHGVILP